MALKQRIVVVGVGSIGKRHARLLYKRKNITVELFDPNQKSLEDARKEFGQIPYHLSFHEMLKSKPDMILIASPHQFHTKQTINALKAGIHVLCEKPMSDKLITAREVLKFNRTSNKVLVYGFSNHFHPGVLRIKQILESGLIGNIRHIHFSNYLFGADWSAMIVVQCFFVLLVNISRHFRCVSDMGICIDYKICFTG